MDKETISSVKKYTLRYKLHILALAVIYCFIFTIFFWSIDNRDPIRMIQHTIRPEITTPAGEVYEHIRFERILSCEASISRKLVSLDGDSITAIRFAEHPLYPVSGDSQAKEYNVVDFVVLPAETPVGKWKYETSLIFQCNPLKRTIVQLDPLTIEVK